MVLLEAIDLAKQIDDRVLWQGINFNLEANDILALRGPSGSGKTVMLRTLAGLEPIQSGQILYNNKPQSDYEMPVYRSNLIYLQQRPSFASKTVLESIQRPFSFRVHQNKNYDANLVAKYLKSLARDDDFLTKEVTKLSGGEEQIVALLRALILEPEVLLLDEATASLDQETSQKFEQLIKDYITNNKRAAIWISHDQNQSGRISNKEINL